MESSQIKNEVIKIIQDYLKSKAFTDVQITDTPTEAFQIVNRKFVTLNGSTANRPRGSVLGQSYFDTSLGKPVWWNGTGFVDATGIYV